MNDTPIFITESDIRKIVKKSIQKILTEAYDSTLYHFTNLEGLYGILSDNCLAAIETGDDGYDEENNEAVCLSRTGNPYIGYCPNTEYGLIFRIDLDAEKMCSSIRGMKIRPWSMNNPRTLLSRTPNGVHYSSVSDYEERANNSIEPLNIYCKAIEVFPVHKGQGFDEEQLEIIEKLKTDFPQWNKFFNF